MRYSRLLSLINGLMMSGNVVAAAMPATPLFSPHLDLTLYTHWDAQTQDMAPVDLTNPALTHGEISVCCNLSKEMR